MSIKNFVEEKIKSLREQIVIWDNPSASSEQRGKVLASLIGDDPRFWGEVAKLATIKSPKTMTRAQIVNVVAEMKTVAEPPVKQTTIVLESAPAPKPVKPTTPAPVTVAPRTLKLNVGGSDFAAKINGVAAEMCLGGDKSPLGKFRTAMIESQDVETCHRAVVTVLNEHLINELPDWQLLTGKMKRDRFFLDRKTSGAFLAQCPVELVTDLLLAEDGMWDLVEEIRVGQGYNNTASPYRISFVIDACVMAIAVDGDNKGLMTLLTNSKHAVNRMKQMGLISADHWLVQKVAAMKPAKPARLAAPIETVPEQTEAMVDHKLDNIQQVAEEVVVGSATIN